MSISAKTYNQAIDAILSYTSPGTTFGIEGRYDLSERKKAIKGAKTARLPFILPKDLFKSVDPAITFKVFTNLLPLAVEAREKLRPLTIGGLRSLENLICTIHWQSAFDYTPDSYIGIYFEDTLICYKRWMNFGRWYGTWNHGFTDRKKYQSKIDYCLRKFTLSTKPWSRYFKVKEKHTKYKDLIQKDGIVNNRMLVDPNTLTLDYRLASDWSINDLSGIERMKEETKLIQERLQIWQSDPLLKEIYAFSNT